MHRLHDVPNGFERAQRRDEIAREAGRDWLKNQGAKAGFAVETCDAAGYRTLAVPREGKKPIQLGVLDLEGRIEIEDFSAFLPALTRGFGKAKGFGCGLMLRDDECSRSNPLRCSVPTRRNRQVPRARADTASSAEVKANI